MASVWGELKRRNVIKVAVAYAIVGWLLVEVSSVLLPAFEAPDWVLRVVILLIGIGFALTVVVSWFYDLTSQGLERTGSPTSSASATDVAGRKLDFAIIGALVLVLGFVVVDNYVLEDDTVATGFLPNSVAVLPFDNLSPDPDNAYFAAGMHEEILNQLAKLHNLNVISRTSVLQYADSRPPIPQIASELNVQAILEGSVRFDGENVLIQVQLIDAATDSHLWSDSYEREFAGVFGIQADVAMNVANALETEFSPEEQANIARAPTASPEAYQLYLRALATGGGAAGRLLLEQAIEIDPDFALAYAFRATIGNIGLAGIGGVSPAAVAETERTMQRYAEQALALDPTLGIVYAALAVPHSVHWRGSEAERLFQRAIELSPKDVTILSLYGRFKRFRGEYDESIRLLRAAVELDPNNLQSRNFLAQSYRQSGNWETASMVYSDLLERAGTHSGGMGRSVYAGAAEVEAILGNDSQAIALLRVAERLESLGAYRLAQMAHTYSLAGERDDAMRLFAQFEREASENRVSDAVWVRAFIAIDNYEQALQRLESAVQNRVLGDLAALAGIRANPWRDPELDSPAFRTLVSNLWDDD